jgi:putative transcriptional regulator
MKLKSLKGQLLISSGGLFDQSFRHTVVLVGEHDSSGAVGVVLNRPLDHAVEEAIPALAELVAAGSLVFEGGPVEPQSAVVLAEFSQGASADLVAFGNVGFLTGDVSSEVRPAVLRARVFAGHAGWGPGQLEEELERDSWLHCPAQVEDVFTDAPELLWSRVMKRLGPEYELMSRMPFDPSMN